MDSASSTAGTSAFPSDENGSFNAGGISSISSLTAVSTRYQYYLDKATPFVLWRWVSFGVLVFIYVIRVVLLKGFYIVSYGLGIYMLNLFIPFLSPQVDPEMQQLLVSDGAALPTLSSDEFRPFVRRLLEFKFWYSMTKAFIIAFTMTFFNVFDVPVFWPILLFYWVVLFTVTMKRQILHMIKYRYVPFTFGKQRYDKRRTVPAENAGSSKGSA